MFLTTIVLFTLWCWTGSPVLAVAWIITGIIAARSIGTQRKKVRR